MTVDAFEESLRATEETGMNGYLTKPIEPRKLFEELRKQTKGNFSPKMRKEA